MGAVLHQRQRVLIQIAVQIAAEDGSGLFGQWAVHIHREVGHGLHQPLVLDLPDEVQKLLGTAHGEGGNDHITALGDGLIDDLGQLVGVAPHLRVIAVAVGGLHENIVRPVEELRVADNRLIHIADVPGEHDGPRLAALPARQADTGRAQQVSCVDKFRRHPIGDLHRLAVLTGLHEFAHPHSVGHGVDGLDLRPASPPVLAVLILRVLLLNVGGVLQHNVQQVRRQPGGDDAALKTVLDKHGDTARVVDMGVGHQHHIDAAGMERQHRIVYLVPSLLQAAVHQNILAVDLQAVAAAGNAPVSAVKAQLHGGNSFLHSLGISVFQYTTLIPLQQPSNPSTCTRPALCVA